MPTPLIVIGIIGLLVLLYIALVKRIGEDQKRDWADYVKANPHLFRKLTLPEPRGGCPCLYTTPCDPQCTCVKPYSSRGCNRCCSYGSVEQRKQMAEYLVRMVKGMR